MTTTWMLYAWLAYAPTAAPMVYGPYPTHDACMAAYAAALTQPGHQSMRYGCVSQPR